jgi:hypothetical protein
LSLDAQWHFGALFAVRARLRLSQQFSETGYESPRELDWSDLYLSGGWAGITEPHTLLKLSGDLLLVLPTSRVSQFSAQLFTIGPRVVLSRTFEVLHGLTVGYGARPVLHLNGKAACVPAPYYGCAMFPPTGSSEAAGRDPNLDAGYSVYGRFSNVFFDIGHGPFVSFRPHERVGIEAALVLNHGWEYNFLIPSDLPPRGPVPATNLIRLLLSVSWQFSRPVGVSLTLFSFAQWERLENGQTFFDFVN